MVGASDDAARDRRRGWWTEWSGIDDFTTLASSIRRRFAAEGLTDLLIGVDDAQGELHLIATTDERLPSDAADAGWRATDLRIDGRRVGRIWHLDPRAIGEEIWDELVAQTAVAVDLVAARVGRRTLRRGLAELDRLTATFAQALAAEEVGEVAVRAVRDVLVEAGCAVLELDEHDDHVRLLAHDTPTRVERLAALGLTLDRSALDRACQAIDTSVVVTALEVDERRRGYLVAALEPGLQPTPDERRLVALVARQTAHALHRVRRAARSSADRFAEVLDAMVDLVTVERAVRDEAGHIVDFRIEYMNAVQIDVAGRPRDAIIGRRLSDVYPAAMGSELFERYRAVVETGEPFLVDELPYADTIDDQTVTGHYTLQVSRFGDGIIISTRDVSEAVGAKQELRMAYERLAAAQHLARMGIWRISLQGQRLTFSDELYRIFELPPDEPIPAVPESIVALIHPRDREAVRRLIEQTPLTGEPFAVELAIQRPSGEGIILATGSVAYDAQGQPIELWGTAQDLTEQRRSEQLLEDTAEQLQKEHETVVMLQEAFAPALPDVPDGEVAGRYLAAGPDTQVGGDWYDVVPADTHLFLVIGDVAGHGLPAVALMAQLRNAIRTCVVQRLPPGRCLEIANQVLLTASDDTQLATSIVARIDRGSREILWASAGHPPLLRRPTIGAVEILTATQGPPLGFDGGYTYAEQRLVLEAGDLVLGYTDGLIEERGTRIDHRIRLLADVATELPAHDLSSYCEAICNRMFIARERRDDVCIVAWRTR